MKTLNPSTLSAGTLTERLSNGTSFVYATSLPFSVTGEVTVDSTNYVRPTVINVIVSVTYWKGHTNSVSPQPGANHRSPAVAVSNLSLTNHAYNASARITNPTLATVSHS